MESRSLAVWLVEDRKCSVAVVGLDLVLGLISMVRYGGVHTVRGMSPYIMGLTTQDPHIQKENTELYKILKFRVNWANIEQDTAIQKLENLVTNVWIAGHLSGNPYISLRILKFLNGCILAPEYITNMFSLKTHSVNRASGRNSLFIPRVNTNYLLTESEGFTGKSRTETLPY